MEESVVKSLTMILCGKELPTKRIKVASAVYSAIATDFGMVDKGAMWQYPQFQMLCMMGMCARALTDSSKSLAEVQEYCTTLVSAAGVLVECDEVANMVNREQQLAVRSYIEEWYGLKDTAERIAQGQEPRWDCYRHREQGRSDILDEVAPVFYIESSMEK